MYDSSKQEDHRDPVTISKSVKEFVAVLFPMRTTLLQNDSFIFNPDLESCR